MHRIPVLAAGILCFFCACKKEQKELLPEEYPQILKNVQHGDLICRHGTGFWSERILKQNPCDKRFSHIGAVIQENQTFYVIHADTDNAYTGSGKVRKETLVKFLMQAKRTGIFRFREPPDPEVFARTAHIYVGRDFDWKFNLAEESSVYCTELIQCILKQAKPELRLKTEELAFCNVIPVDSCTDPAFAECIYDSENP